MCNEAPKANSETCRDPYKGVVTCSFICDPLWVETYLVRVRTHLAGVVVERTLGLLGIPTERYAQSQERLVKH